MYSLVIADDEYWVRERIVKETPWEKINVQVAGTAEDGQEALRLVEELRPDLLITDIRMPMMDGVELMHEIQKRQLPVRLIVLSGYDEFKYAKEALRFGACDYILKPVEEEELLQTVKRCLLEIAFEREKEGRFRRLEQTVRASGAYLREQALRSVLNGEYRDNAKPYQGNGQEDAAAVLFAEHASCSQHLCVLLHIDRYEELGEEKELVRFILTNILTERLSTYGFCCQTGLGSPPEFAFLVSMEECGGDILQRIVEDVKEVVCLLQEKLGLSLCAGIGETCESFWDSSYACRTASQVLGYRKWLGTNQVFETGKISLEVKISEHYSTAGLSALLAQNRLEEALAEMKEIYERVERGRGSNPVTAFKMLLLDFGNVFYVYFRDRYNTGYANVFRMELLDSLDIMEYLEDFWRLVRRFADKSSDSGNKSRQLVRKALEWLQENYSRPVSLHDMAQLLQLNPSYFCRIFKDETGIPFVTYLQQLRVEKAVELMKDPVLRIYEISSLVGYENQQYFNKIFKNLKGMPPQAYRDHME